MVEKSKTKLHDSQLIVFKITKRANKGPCCSSRRAKEEKSWYAYVVTTRIANRLFLRAHIDYEAFKKDPSVEAFSKSMATSLCNFQTFIAQEFVIRELMREDGAESENVVS